MRKSSIALSTAFLASATAAVWLWSQWAQERARNLELETQLGRLQERPTNGAPPSGAVEPATPRESAGAPAAPRPAQGLAELDPDSVPLPHGNERQHYARMLGNPEFQKAMRAQQRVTLEAMYRDLPRVLDLSPEQTERLFDLMAEQAIPDLDVLGSRRTNNQDDYNAALRAVDERQRQHDARLRELLGDSKRQQLQHYRESLQSRQEVNSLRNDLAASSEPLRQDQVESMVDLIHAEQQRLDQDMRDFAAIQPGSDARAALQFRGSKLAIAANERIIEASRSLLSNGQHAALKDLYRRQKVQMEAQDTLARLQAEAMKAAAAADTSN